GSSCILILNRLFSSACIRVGALASQGHFHKYRMGPSEVSKRRPRAPASSVCRLGEIAMPVAIAKESLAPPVSPASWKVFSSSLGWIAIAYTREQLLGVSFGHSTPQRAQQSLQVQGQVLQSDSQAALPAWVTRLEKQLVKLAN